VLGVLKHRAYLDGTRYYVTAECFLFFASQLLRSTTDARLQGEFAPLLRERILERAGAGGDALALSMRVLAGMVVGVRLEREVAELLPLQCEDGGWGLSWVYRYGKSGIKIGNRGLTTAFALNAIAALKSPPQLRPLNTLPEKRAPEAEPQLLQPRLGGRHVGLSGSYPSVPWWLVLISLILSGLLFRTLRT
jgi:hypothetical protein